MKTWYFIAAIGRSGTCWLARLLDGAAGHTCAHEEGDTRSKTIPQPWTPFPLDRWMGRESYGEVNGMLRYHLSGQHLGREMEIEKRLYLRRAPLDIIASWMTQGSRPEEDLSATAAEVLWHARNLEVWAWVSGSPVMDVETLWADRARVQGLVDWLGLDLQVTPEMMRPANGGDRARREAWIWTEARLATVRRAAARVGYDPDQLTTARPDRVGASK